jgi:hypothetical protein
MWQAMMATSPSGNNNEEEGLPSLRGTNAFCPHASLLNVIDRVLNITLWNGSIVD